SQDINSLQGNIEDKIGNNVDVNVLGKEWDTLDEPILDTLLRDVRGIASKVRHIFMPLSSADIYKNVLKNWDLWGPLILCTFMSLTLHHNDGSSSSSFV